MVNGSSEVWCQQSRDDYGLILYDVIHCGLVTVLGTLSNSLALWCVAGCTKTRRPVKVLLISVFVPLLLLCLLGRPLIIIFLVRLLGCRQSQVDPALMNTTILSDFFLEQVELVFITVLAVVRVVAVWCPQKSSLSMREAAVLVTVCTLYCFLTCMGLQGPLVLGYVQDDLTRQLINTIHFTVNGLLPPLLTAGCYASMMVAMQKNKRRLEHHQQKGSRVVDEATRAMLAVFVSNLVFGLPHAVHHLRGHLDSYRVIIIIHIIFNTHFVVDPIVFICFNTHYRRRVAELVAGWWCCRSMARPTASSRCPAGRHTPDPYCQVSEKTTDIKLSEDGLV